MEVSLSFDQGKYVPTVIKHKCTTLKQGDDQFHIWDVGNWHSTLDVRESSPSALASMLKLSVAQVSV